MKRNCISRSNWSMLAILIAISSCEPIFIPDPINPQLPKYTEDGNNVAGALINNELWTESEWIWGIAPDRPMVFQAFHTDSLQIQFAGALEDKSSVVITFVIRNGAHTLLDLATLSGKKFQLGDGDHAVYLSNTQNCNGTGIGQIYFRSVKFNSERQRVIISGTFGFTVSDSSCGPLEVTYGRFDFRIHEVYLQ